MFTFLTSVGFFDLTQSCVIKWTCRRYAKRRNAKSSLIVRLGIIVFVLVKFIYVCVFETMPGLKPVRSAVTLDPDVKLYLVDYATRQYGTAKAMSRALNDIVRRWFITNDVIETFNKNFQTIMSALNAIEKAHAEVSSNLNMLLEMAGKCGDTGNVVYLKYLASVPAVINDLRDVMDELEKIVNTYYKSVEPVVMFNKIMDAIGELSSSIAMIKSAVVPVHTIHHLTNEISKRLTRLEDVFADLLTLFVSHCVDVFGDKDKCDEVVKRIESARAKLFTPVTL